VALTDYSVAHFSAVRPYTTRPPTAGHTGANAALHGLGGARMPPSLQEGNKRAYSAKQGR